MKIKKYVAKSMPEAMTKIRNDLGSDAVILNSKEITKGGFLGFFKRRKIEVIAALDSDPLQKESNEQMDDAKRKKQIIESYTMTTDKTDKVLNELAYLKKMIKSQSNIKDTFLPDYEIAYQYLIDQEVDEEIAHSLIQRIYESHEKSGEQSNRELIFNDLKEMILNKLNVLSFEGISFKNKVIQFVGPTGVGKTTTLAKVAAHCMLEQKKKIALITTDTYRIAAIDQLKTYARILNVPLEVAYSKDDYEQAINKFADFDLILIDTAGRNYHDVKYINELKNFIDTNEKIETYLTLSLTAKATDIKTIYEQFKPLLIDKVIFTKLDETASYGSILNICLTYSIGVPYLTNGQDVPDDLIKPDPHYITNLLLSRFSK